MEFDVGDDVMTLDELRVQLDALDLEIMALLNKRQHACIQVGEIKKGSGQEVHDPEREDAILRRLEDLNCGPFPNDALHDVYARILKASADEQRRIVDAD